MFQVRKMRNQSRRLRWVPSPAKSGVLKTQKKKIFQEESTVLSAVGRCRLRIDFGNMKVFDDSEELFP